MSKQHDHSNITQGDDAGKRSSQVVTPGQTGSENINYNKLVDDLPDGGLTADQIRANSEKLKEMQKQAHKAEKQEGDSDDGESSSTSRTHHSEHR